MEESLKRMKYSTIIFSALAGGTFWSTVRSSGYGSGPSLGLLWGLLWVVLIWKLYPENPFPKNSSFLLLAFIIGFGWGGTQGYGQFNQWIQGKFYLVMDQQIFVPINPMYGWGNLFICGLTWAGFPALLISWTIFPKQNNKKVWFERIFVGFIGAAIILIAYEIFPQLFLPLYNEGYYSNLSICPDCQRTMDTAVNTYTYLGIFLALTIHTLLLNSKSKHVILPISLGLALFMSFGGFFHRLTPNETNATWWKVWEYTCGFGAGLALGITFWYIHKKGFLKEFLNYNTTNNKSETPNVAKKLWWAFWLPLYVAAAMVVRNRFHQTSKFSAELKPILFYLEIGTIIIAFLLFSKRFYSYKNQNHKLETLFVEKPCKLYLNLSFLLFCMGTLSRFFQSIKIENWSILILGFVSFIIGFSFLFISFKNPKNSGKKWKYILS